MAELGLGRLNRALNHFLNVRDDMNRLTVTFDWYSQMLLDLGFAELWLAKGDLVRAREEAQRLLKMTLATVERTWQTLALEVNSRIALAANEIDQAQDYMSKALQTMQGFDLPIAEWVVHATAAEVYQCTARSELAQQHSTMSRSTIERIAMSLETHNALKRAFLKAAPVRKILQSGTTTKDYYEMES